MRLVVEPGLPTSEWLARFVPFSSVHAASALGVIGSVLAACAIGRALRSSGRMRDEETLVVAWAGFVVAVNLFRWIFYRLPGRFEWSTSLPVHPCDVACAVAPLVFLTGWRWPRAMLFFWGIPFALLALVFPVTLRQGPAGGDYYLYWIGHLAIAGTGAYDFVVRGFRPRGSDLRFVASVGVAYFVAIAVLNAVLDANYAYIGDHVLAGTPIEWFGPWPARPILLWATTLGAWILLWRLARKRAPS